MSKLVVPPEAFPVVALQAAGTARPAKPQSVFAEDFSLLIRTPRRLRMKRGQIRVLN